MAAQERERGGYAAVGIEFRHGPTPKGERVGLYSLVSQRVITPLSDIPPSVSDLHAFPLDRLSSPLPSSSLLFRNVVWSGSKPDGGATISRPQKRLRINVPLLLPSLLRPRPITLDSPPPGADYNYRAFCFAIRRGSSPPPRVGASKIPLIFQPAPLCVESSEKTPHLTSFIIVNHRPEMIGGIYFIFRVIIVKKNVTRIVTLL